MPLGGKAIKSWNSQGLISTQVIGCLKPHLQRFRNHLSSLVASSSIEKGLSSLNLFPLTGIGSHWRNFCENGSGRRTFSPRVHLGLGTKFCLLGAPLTSAKWFQTFCYYLDEDENKHRKYLVAFNYIGSNRPSIILP